MSPRRALITGITGQDGSYLSELLLDKGYEVHGLVRRVAIEDPDHRLPRIQHIRDRLTLHTGSIESYASVHSIVSKVLPHECYHLAADSFVAYGFEDESSTFSTNINGTHHILGVLRDQTPECRFYFAGSSEMFGQADESPQSENSRFRPRSAYGISKVAGYELTRNYREQYGLHASTGILFNHESPRRGYEFVTRKISSGVAKIVSGREKKLKLGNLTARRDWGHARDYVDAMWRMLQQEQPDDYVIATGQTHTVGDFAAAAFEAANLDWTEYVETDPSVYRPSEPNVLVGNSAKAQQAFGWHSRVSFPELVAEMVNADLKLSHVQPEAIGVRLRRGA